MAGLEGLSCWPWCGEGLEFLTLAGVSWVGGFAWGGWRPGFAVLVGAP